jgi:hypothetical protein
MTANHQIINLEQTMSDDDWQDLIDGISSEKCIIVIGPEIYTEEGDSLTTEKRLAAWLRQQADRLKIRVYDNGWFHLQPGGNANAPLRQIKEFYKQPQPQAEQLLQRLACIRFPVLLSLNPDDRLYKAFAAYPTARFEAYVRNEPARTDLSKPTADEPLVYNLLGRLEDRNSLVLTYDDFYDYLKSVFAGSSMSAVLKDTILNANQFIFLGIPFDQWYVHLFMRILNQSDDDSKKKPKYATLLSPELAESCFEQYNITFVNHNIADFVEELLRRCENHPEREGLLRPAPAFPAKGETAIDKSRAEQFIQMLKDLVADNRYPELYDQVKKALGDAGAAGKELMINFIAVKAKYQDISEQQSLGILNSENYNIEMGKIRLSFLYNIDKLQESWPQLNIKLP